MFPFKMRNFSTMTRHDNADKAFDLSESNDDTEKILFDKTKKLREKILRTNCILKLKKICGVLEVINLQFGDNKM